MTRINPLSQFYYQTLILQRNINQNQNVLDRTLERLSTGLRINRAADDPFGITQAKRIQTQQISNQQASDNILQAFSLAATAENGAKSIQNNLTRMRELILQSLNDTSTGNDRARIQTEIDKLIADTDRIARSEIFNNRKLLDGSLSQFKLAQPASSALSINQSLTDSAGNTLSFLSGTPTVSDQVSDYDRVQFQLFDNGSGGYGLNISTASGGVVLSYNDVLSAPTSLNVPMGGSTVSFERAAYAPAPTSGFGPLSSSEFADSLDQLVSAGRLDPVSNGSLSLQLGSQTFANFYSVTGSSSLQELLTTINGLTSGLSASYDTNTGKIAVTYNNQSTETTSRLTSYASAGTTTGVGGPYTSFALLPSAPAGPAYRDPSGFLPASGFNLTAPPSDFPALPGSLNTAVSFAGSDSSILSVLGLADTSNNGTVFDYTAAFYGQALSTGNPGEYVNRTLVSIENVTASQSLSGSNTGLSPSDLDTTFRVLNTALVSSSAFAPGDLTIDFGSAGIFSYQAETGSLFDPETNSIQDLLTAINNFNPTVVSASFNPTTAELTLINAPPPSTTEAKVTDPGLSNGSFSIDFGSNGVFNYTLDLNSSTIPDFLTALNSFNGNVSASFDATSDTFTLTNQVSPTYDTKLTDPGLTVGGTLTADYGSNGSKSITLTNTTTIQDVITALGTSGVTVSYDESADTLNFTNTASGPTSTSDTKIDGSTLGSGTFSIDFGTNGSLNFGNINGGDVSINSFLDAINNYTGEQVGGSVSAVYDAANDRIVINNTSVDQITTITTDIGTKLNENGIGNSVLEIDFGANGIFTSSQPLRNLTLEQVVNEIKAFKPGFVDASFDLATDSISLSNKAPDDIPDDPGTTGTPKVSTVPSLSTTNFNIRVEADTAITSIDISLDLANATIQDVVNALNGKKFHLQDAGLNTGEIRASYSDFDDKFVLTFDGSAGIYNVDVIFTGADEFLNYFKLDLVPGGGNTPSYISTSQIDNGSTGSPLDIVASDVTSKTLTELLTETYGGTPPTPGTAYDNKIDFLSAGAAAFFNITDATNSNSDPNTNADNTNSVSGSNIDNAGDPLLDIDSTDYSSRTIDALINTVVQTTSTTTTPGNNQILFNDTTTGLPTVLKLTDTISTGTGLQTFYGSDIDKGNLNAALNLDDAGDLNKTLSTLATEQIITGSTPAGNNAITFTDSSGLASLFKLSNVASNVGGGSGTYTQSTGSSAAIDNGPQGQPLDVNGTDVNGTSLLNLSQTSLLSSGGNDNSITFSAGLGEKIRTFFDLSDRASNASSSLSGTYSQSTTSPAAIDNGTSGSPYDITAADITSGTALTFQELITPFASGSATNTITFGGALGPVLTDFFNLNPINPSTGSDPQSIVSSPGIDNRSVDPSLTLQATDLTRSLASLYTPKLGLISGPLVIDGNTVLTIDPDQDTLNDVLTAINAYSGNSNQTYIASFNSGALEIEVIDQESLTAPGSAAALDPNGATPQINGNQITLDTASYLVGGAPPDAYPTFSTTALPAPYQFTAPTATTLSSAISFSGSSNLFSVLGLSNVSTGSPTPSGSAEYRGTYTQTDAVNYVLNGEQRQTFTATSTAISPRIGNDTVGPPLSGIPNDGIVAEVAIAPAILSQSGQGLIFQVGPNQGNTLSLSINGLTADLLNLEGLKLYRAGDSDTLARLRANNALQVVDQALEQTLNTLGQIGVGMGILDLQLRQSEERNQVFSQTLSDLQDANVEEEIANLTKAQINIQVGATLQAQNAADTQRIYDLLFNSQQNINPLFNSFLNS